MKPHEARARRKAAEAQRAAMSENLRTYLAEDNPLDRVVPELIPTEQDRDRLVREVRRLGKVAERQQRGPARNRKIDQMLPMVGQLVVMDRVLGLDRLERAGLTPRRLRELARGVSQEEMRAKVAELHGAAPARLDGPR